jgi:hypothetical protein
MSRCKVPVAKFVLTDLQLSDGARVLISAWAARNCSDWSFSANGFAGTFLKPKPYNVAQCHLLTCLKRWAVEKPAGSGWMQFEQPGGEAAKTPTALAPKRTWAEYKAAQRAKDREMEDALSHSDLGAFQLPKLPKLPRDRRNDPLAHSDIGLELLELKRARA